MPSLRTERGSDPVTGVGGATVVGPPSSDVLEKLKGEPTSPGLVIPSLDEEGSGRARTEVLPTNALPPRPMIRDSAAPYDRAETAILTVSSGEAIVLAPPPSLLTDGPMSSVSGTALAAQPAAMRDVETSSPDSEEASPSRQARTNKTLMALAGLLFVVAAGIVILALARG